MTIPHTVPKTAQHTKRLRVFAGPNGSGKSSLLDYLVKIRSFKLYYHINADDIARDIAVGCDFSNWPSKITADELIRYFNNSAFQKLADYRFCDTIEIADGVLSLKRCPPPDLSYLCAAIADFLRVKMMERDSSFSFETVFSHSSKIDELIFAKEKGFITYLYIITTESPTINLARIKNRIQRGGHAVPDEKVLERYEKTMNNLAVAVKYADRVYFFDNSGADEAACYQYFAEKRDGKICVRNTHVPLWFERYMPRSE